ncbi:MAG: M50 family metallopeptidase [Candidatus Aenigmatarchaeota archaeon]
MERKELIDLTLAILLATFIFSFQKIEYFFTYLIIVLISFLPHELAHRYLARKFGYIAFFQIWPPGILIALLALIASSGLIKFIALGAVMIYPISFRGGFLIEKRISIKENALISLAGPLVNIVICILSLLLYLTTKVNFLLYIAQVNAWISVFNLLPIFPLDGSKIFIYSYKKWILIFFLSILLFVSTYIG